MKLIYVWLLFLNYSWFVSAADSNCPNGSFYQNDLDSCLFASSSSESGDIALQICRQMGGDLLSVHNAFQNSLIAQIQKNLTGEPQGWLGARFSNGAWIWSDASPFDYSRLFQASAAGSCAYLDGQDLMWKIASCSKELKFLCAIPSSTSDTTPSPFTDLTTSQPSPLVCLPPAQQDLYNCKQGWQYFPTTGFEYLVMFDIEITKAEATCVSQGGHLVSIHSEAENEFVMDLCCPSLCQLAHHGFIQFFLTGGYLANGSHFWTDSTPFDYKHNKIIGHLENTVLQIENNYCETAHNYSDWYGGSSYGGIIPIAICKRTKRN